MLHEIPERPFRRFRPTIRVYPLEEIAGRVRDPRDDARITRRPDIEGRAYFSVRRRRSPRFISPW